MVDRPRLVHLLNLFCSGAIPHIIRDLQPVIGQYFDVHIVVLQKLVDEKWLVDEFRDLGITVHALDCERWNMPLAAMRLRDKLNELQPSTVHAHAGRASMLAPFCCPAGVPVYVTYHSLADGYSFATRNALRFTDRLLAGRTGVSDAVTDSWGELGVRSAKTIYNPVDLARHQVSVDEIRKVREEFCPSSDTSLFVNVGRLTRAKAQDVLIDAVGLFSKERTADFRLVIAGRGPDEDKLKQQAVRLGLQDKVIFAGFRNDIPALLAAADVFVFPSRWEGLPVTVLETMASQTAAIVSDIAPCRECIKDGETGLLTPLEDPKALCVNIGRLVDNTALRTGLASAAREYVRETFSPEKIAHDYLALYESAQPQVGAERVRR